MKRAILFSMALTMASPALARQPDDSRLLPAGQAAHELARFAGCVALKRGPEARAAVLAGYLSPEQAKATNALYRSVDDPCMTSGGEDVKMSFRSDLLTAAVAEALLERDYPDFPTVVDRNAVDVEAERGRVAGLSVAERFGRCIVWSNPAGVQELLKTDAEMPAEMVAMQALNHDMGMCLEEGSTLRLSRTFVRGISAIAAYRLAQQLRPRPNGERG